MLTDWLIIRRLAAELEAALRGGRIDAVGAVAGGRTGIRIARGREPGRTLVVDAFGETPLAFLEDAEPTTTTGWPRALGAALGGMRVERVRARRGDRLIALDCSARSRFGVATEARLVLELVPRFGNVLLVRDGAVVIAAKEFTRAENPRRAVVVGEPYEPPPLPVASAEPEAALARIAANLADAAETARALRSTEPLCPHVVALAYATETATLADAVRTEDAARALAERLLGRARALLAATAGEPEGDGDVFVYLHGPDVVQAHVVPLAQFAHLTLARERALLPVCTLAIARTSAARMLHATEQRRRALRARLEKRAELVAREREALARERDDELGRGALRSAAELLYTYQRDVAPGATSFVPPDDPTRSIPLDPGLDAKANAAGFFRRYRKATVRIDHLRRRLEVLESEERTLAQLAWELDRAAASELDELADLLAPHGAKRRPTRPKREPNVVVLGPDARVLVGRSPLGNAELTFRIARPTDLWLHAKDVPGAHVILRIDGGREATEAEIAAAASLAAWHSRARESDGVEVDLTRRVHVRKRRDAAPGLVWYTNARALRATPREFATESPPPTSAERT